MDSYAKSWLTFIVPTYFFLVTGFIMFLCSKSSQMAKIFGTNITKVLATLFQFSYTLLIESVVTAISSTSIQYKLKNGREVTKLVWLYDPNVEFFTGKHIPLVLVGIIFGLLTLAYTLVLLFIQPLQRYSHLCCLSWVAKLKPFIDAYTAPHIIKDHCRYWEGLLLLFRLIIAVQVAVAVNTKSTMNFNLSVIVFMCILLLTITWCVGGVYMQEDLSQCT